MKFPNALKGIKRIYLAEILSILSVGLMFLSMVLVFAGVGAASAGEGSATGLAVGGGIFMIGTAVLSIVGFIIQLLGISDTSKDEPLFKTALYLVIVEIICGIVGTAFQQSNPTLYSIFALVERICGIGVFWFCVGGIESLADKCGNAEVAARANNLVKLIVAVYLVGIVLSAVGSFVSLSATIAGIITLVSCICMLVAYVLYLRLLGDAKNMLAAA